MIYEDFIPSSESFEIGTNSIESQQFKLWESNAEGFTALPSYVWSVKYVF